MTAMMLFICATTLPVVLIGLGAIYGGVWVVLALVYMTGLTFLLDWIVRRVTPPGTKSEFPAADVLSSCLAVVHFPLLALVVWSLGTPQIGIAAKIALFLAAGQYFGQVGNANAHELIHRSNRGLHKLGMWVYISLLFGHHTSAHVLVHHRHVATPTDPNTSRTGESFYSYFARAWKGSFIQGLRAEAARLARIDRGAWRNPYLVYILGAVGFVVAAHALGGWPTTLAYLALALYAQAQLLLSDYVQHYGLTRVLRDGKAEPVGPRHSWNSPHWFSSALLLNAPRHSDHHAHPARPFPALALPQDVPTLPHSLPVMATLALFPSRWFHVMDRHAARWQP
jgi:alkane 1-monooxygenase